ncbi:IMP cyclohydrolase [Halorientalis sp. IM1011]|uniref:IMP cyclohydrolase n=1 Tax=Halorientalis sp. IM1011 TaxID=1932360 RepID=UPI00097CD50B|nr:IMP cyclohydrolase [Halorientalis sp. IM1011]AQL42769.1 IMP cyclohydrolase [Halorientalis sp. IM1011]
MYVGRFVVVAPDRAAYRVSSRSFPNRRIVAREGGATLTVGPTEDAPETDNPYISYNCVREVDGSVVVGNGSHVDPIAEKLGLGYPARDALAESLLALDYEKDDYDTPRIAGVVGGSEARSASNQSSGEDSDPRDDESYIGTVRKDALLVEQVEEPTLVATYEEDSPTAFDLDSEDAADIASEVYDHEFEHAVCAAGVVRDGDGIETAIENGE